MWVDGDKKNGNMENFEESLLDVFEAEKDVQVPNIFESIEVEIATKKHLSIS